MLGRYELLEQVGSGGMAVVYRGRDTALAREVAVKLLHPHLASSAESRARFAREARAVARLSHPNVVEIYDYSGDAAPEAYLVTEFIRGRTLRVFAREEGFGFPEVAMLAGRALADALVHAHSAGVIHRDLKPENVLVEVGARPALKLADFGIARILASDERMTMTGTLVGSPHHMAPEIVEGKEADARSDLFSLGTLLYWLATGHLPFAAANPTAILRRVLEGDFEDPRLAEPRVPDALATLVARCLALDPARRPAAAAEVRDALDRILAECGLERPDDELTAFLRDPAAFRAAFPPRAVASLKSCGDAALRQGASARALAFYNRVLAIDPSDREVPERLARLSRRARAGRALRAAAVVATAAVAFGGLGLALRARHPPPSAGVVSAGTPRADLPAEPGPEAPAPWSAIPPAHASAESASSAGRPPPRAARPPPRAVPPSVVLTVLVRPYAQRALLDGVEVASGEQSVRFELTPGRSHLIQIEHACCVPFVKELTADDALRIGELRVPLEARPARLRVEGDPATRISVGDRFVGTAGDSQHAALPVPVPAGGESPYEAAARVLLEPPGAAPRTVQLRLRAGGEVVIAAPTDEEAP